MSDHKLKIGDVVRFDLELAKSVTKFSRWAFVPEDNSYAVVDFVIRDSADPNVEISDIRVNWLKKHEGQVRKQYNYNRAYLHLVDDPDELALIALSMIGEP
jgi:hypothetical protein